MSMGLDGSSAMNTIAPGTRERALLSERVAWFNTDSERLTHDAVVLRRSNASSVATSKDAPTATLHPADPPPAPVTGGLSRIRTPAKSSKELPPVKNNQSLQQMNSKSAKVRKGDAPSIARLLAHKDLKGMTAFMLGVRRNHLNFIRFLLQRYKSGKYCNALLRTKNEYAGNETAVMLACRHGLEHAVELMLDCCREKNRSREQEQGADGLPLGEHAEGSELEDDSALSVREVLNARTTEEKSCFLLACQYNRVQVCKALLYYDHSKHRKFLLEQTDKEKRDALGIAKLYDAHGVVGLLQELE
eukprot:g1308.t1